MSGSKSIRWNSETAQHLLAQLRQVWEVLQELSTSLQANELGMFSSGWNVAGPLQDLAEQIVGNRRRLDKLILRIAALEYGVKRADGVMSEAEKGITRLFTEGFLSAGGFSLQPFFPDWKRMMLNGFFGAEEHDLSSLPPCPQRPGWSHMSQRKGGQTYRLKSTGAILTGEIPTAFSPFLPE